jgi:hypothetical protein
VPDGVEELFHKFRARAPDFDLTSFLVEGREIYVTEYEMGDAE